MRNRPVRQHHPRVSKQRFWRVSREWHGQTCAILGGGPGLNQAQCEQVRAAGLRAIAVNNSYLIAPWADILYFCDGHWWDEHHGRKEYRRFPGRKVTLENKHVLERAAVPANMEPELLALCNYGKEPRGICREPDGVYTGSNSGFQALNLAVHLGAARILLLGFDMRVVGHRTHWHDGHPRPTPHDVYKNWMIPAFEAAVKDLQALGVEVINCTPGSALQCFPVLPLDEVLCPAPGA